jgi:hypothetical protein
MEELRSHHVDPAVRLAGRPGASSGSPGTGRRERSPRPCRRRGDINRHGLRRRIDPGQSAGLGSGVARGRRPGTLGSARRCNVARRRASGRTGGGCDPRGRPGRFQPGPRRSALRSDGAVARLGRRLGRRGPAPRVRRADRR